MGRAAVAALLLHVAVCVAAAVHGPVPDEAQPAAPPPNMSAEHQHRSRTSLPHILDGVAGASLLYRELARAAGQSWVDGVCMTGLDAHAAAVLLLSSPKAVVYHFVAKDDGTVGQAEALGQEFGSRYVRLEGNTSERLQELAERRPRVQCSLLVAGGGEDAAASAVHLANLRRLASPWHNEVFAVDAGACRPGRDMKPCVGRGAAWTAAVAAGVIIPGSPLGLDGGRRLLTGAFESDSEQMESVALAELGDGGKWRSRLASQMRRPKSPRRHFLRRKWHQERGPPRPPRQYLLAIRDGMRLRRH